MPAKTILPLTSLRFFAAAMILVSHSRGYFGIPQFWAANAPLYHGVSFFFVLSGFILTYAYPKLPDAEAVRRFWVARFARLWPVHIVAALLFILARPQALDFLKSPLGLLDAALFVTLLQSWIPLEVVFFGYNSVSWSVSCEAFFYLVFPLLIAGWARTWPWKLALVAALAGVMLAIGYGIGAPFHGASDQVTLDGLVYISPFTRLAEFALGMTAALVFKRIQTDSKRAATLAELGALAFVAWSMTFGPFWFYLGPNEVFGAPVAFFLQRTWCAPAFAALIVAVALQRGPIAKLLSSAPLVLLGEVSYAMYLAHPSLLSLCQRWLVDLPPALAYVVFLVALLTFSWAVWRYIETPCRNWIRDAYARRAGRPERRRYVGSQATVAAERP